MTTNQMSGDEKRDHALAVNDKAVTDEVGGNDLVDKVTDLVLASPTTHFTSDLIASILDDENVPSDLVTRRRITSVIVIRGKRKGYWRSCGYETATDSRRNKRPVTVWEILRTVQP